MPSFCRFWQIFGIASVGRLLSWNDMMESLHNYFEREADEGRREDAKVREERYLDEAVKVREQTERIERYEKQLDEWCCKQKRLIDLVQRNTEKLRDLSKEFKLKTTED